MWWTEQRDYTTGVMSIFFFKEEPRHILYYILFCTSRFGIWDNFWFNVDSMVRQKSSKLILFSAIQPAQTLAECVKWLSISTRQWWGNMISTNRCEIKFCVTYAFPFKNLFEHNISNLLIYTWKQQLSLMLCWQSVQYYTL